MKLALDYIQSLAVPYKDMNMDVVHKNNKRNVQSRLPFKLLKTPKLLSPINLQANKVSYKSPSQRFHQYVPRPTSKRCWTP